MNNTSGRFDRIGAGICWSVWASASDEDDLAGMAFKREDGGPGRSLRNDFEIQNRVIGALQQFKNLKGFGDMEHCAIVPHCYDFITLDDESWWQDRLVGAFPRDYLPCNTMRSEAHSSHAGGCQGHTS